MSPNGLFLAPVQGMAEAIKQPFLKNAKNNGILLPEAEYCAPVE